MACYTFIEEFLKRANETKQMDIRIMRVLKEHKNLMVNRLNYFHDNNLYDFNIPAYISKSSDIALNADALFFQIIKATCTGSVNSSRIYDRLQYIKANEYEYLDKLLAEIS